MITLEQLRDLKEEMDRAYDVYLHQKQAQGWSHAATEGRWIDAKLAYQSACVAYCDQLLTKKPKPHGTEAIIK